MLETRLEMDKIAKLMEGQKIKVLIVEKHAAVRRALRERLGATPHLDIIATVQDPAAALPYLLPAPGQGDCTPTPDVILLGLQNGTDEELFKTIDIVRQMVCSRASVIVLAPFADEVERLLLQQAGVKSYLLKYIDSARLIHEIEIASAWGTNPVPAVS